MATVTRVLPWRRAANRPASAEIAELLAAYHAVHPKADTELIEAAFDLGDALVTDWPVVGAGRIK